MSDYEDESPVKVVKKVKKVLGETSGNVAKAAAPAKGGKKGEGRTIEETYQKKTQLEHILLRPDSYIGSCEAMSQPMYVYNADMDKLVNRQVTFVPGLFKIFDEIIVNASDNKQRDPEMDTLKVTIDKENGSVSVWNNGKGVPIAMHQEHKVYVPELIFGHLLTGSNFDDNEKKTTGGRNGYGAKLANIFSTEFTVQTATAESGQKYTQVFRNNMADKGTPSITSYSGTDFTCITFKPDWARFKMAGMDQDIVDLFSKRAYDIAGCGGLSSGKRLKVYLNGNKLPVKSFTEYMTMYKGLEEPIMIEKLSDRWEVGVGVSDGSFQQISFVNSICTSKGGPHVNYIADQITSKLAVVCKKKNKDEIKANVIKNHISIYVNCLIENPAFDSQTKENLTTRPNAFGSTATLSAAMLKAVEKSDIVEKVLQYAKFKQNQQLSKKSGKKAGKLTGIVKLDDANFAGTAKSNQCTLILTEGDSAKTLAVSGLSVVGRDFYGVFPLKGKPLNVRDAGITQVTKNEEIQNVVKILGLKYGQSYENTNGMRYGHLLIMTDQDHDGSHIKGLLINLIHNFWPSLLKIPGFLQEFITPIVKVTKGKNERTFFTLPDYEVWRKDNNEGKGYTIKYYKGLGTSTAKEAKEYFSDLGTHLIDFEWQDDETDGALIEMAFSKKKVDERKDWLRGFKQGTSCNYDVETMKYDSFINDELILFSMADNMRSIPNVIDGFKPSQRKVLFGCFKRNLKGEIKVAQLAGYVSEHSAYHHGEVSLTGTIVGMAQDFAGSNNLNLLTPSGQFGTRLMGGKDSASARYIFTKLEAITRTIFHPDDDALFNYLDDDGLSIEPEFYVPVIPMVLVNGSDGIGTGWSTSVPNYCPRDVIENIRRKLNGKQMVQMQPWWRGFGGHVGAKGGKKGDAAFLVEGRIERTDDETVIITELPVKKWTQDYKAFLETLIVGADAEKGKDGKAKGKGKAAGAGAAKGKGKAAKGGDKDGGEGDDEEGGGGGGGGGAKEKPKHYIKDFKENHTDSTVHFTVSMAQADLDAIEKEAGGLMKFFKLETTVNTTNMTMFNTKGQITRYDSPLDVMEEFYVLRMEYYNKRKAHLMAQLGKEWKRLDNRMRFILAVVDGELIVSNRKKNELLDELKEEGYDMFAPEKKNNNQASDGARGDSGASAGEEEEEEDAESDYGKMSKGYDYLLSMKIWSLTMEKVAKMQAELNVMKKELDALKATTVSALWLRDLDAITVAIDDCDKQMESNRRAEEKQRSSARKNAGKKQSGKGRGGGGRGKKRGADDMDDGDDDSDFEGSSRAKKSKTGSKGRVSIGVLPPLSNLLVDTLGESEAKNKVSKAFAEAEKAGLFGEGAIPTSDNQSKRRGSDSSTGSSGSAKKGKKKGSGGGGGGGSGEDMFDDDEEDVVMVEDEGVVAKVVVDTSSMSLAERLQWKKDGAAIKKAVGPAAGGSSSSKAKTVPKAKKVIAVEVDSDDDDEDGMVEGGDEDDDMFAQAVVPPPRKPTPRAAASKPVTYKDAGDGDSEEEEDEESSSDDGGDDGGDDSDEEDFEKPKKKKAAAAAKPATKPATKPAAKPAAAASKTATSAAAAAAAPIAKKPAAVAAVKKTLTKKQKVVKDSDDEEEEDNDDDDDEENFDFEGSDDGSDFSDDDDAPKKKKKPAAKKPAAAAAAKPKPAAKPAAATTAKAAKAVVAKVPKAKAAAAAAVVKKSNKRDSRSDNSEDDDGDDGADDEEEDAPPAKKQAVSKPAAAKPKAKPAPKPKKKVASKYDSDEEDDDDDDDDASDADEAPVKVAPRSKRAAAIKVSYKEMNGGSDEDEDDDGGDDGDDSDASD